MLTRVAASHLRVGTFEFFAVARRRGAPAQAGRVHDRPARSRALAAAPQPFLALLQAVAERQAALIAQWMNVGFIHGVMNTDNMTISGETIDYGPCAFMEAYDPATVFSSIDHHGRYAFGNQPEIARWNLARLAETLLPLLVRRCRARPWRWPPRSSPRSRRSTDGTCSAASAPSSGCVAANRTTTTPMPRWPTTGWRCSRPERVDFTLGWRRLADAAAGDDAPLRALFADARAPDAWLARWRARCAGEDAGTGHGSTTAGRERAAAMRGVNPAVIPRNHRVEEALAAASDEGDLAPFERLLDALRQPYDESAERDPYAEPAPAAVTARYRTFCGT